MWNQYQCISTVSVALVSSIPPSPTHLTHLTTSPPPPKKKNICWASQTTFLVASYTSEWRGRCWECRLPYLKTLLRWQLVILFLLFRGTIHYPGSSRLNWFGGWWSHPMLQGRRNTFPQLSMVCLLQFDSATSLRKGFKHCIRLQYQTITFPWVTFWIEI